MDHGLELISPLLEIFEIEVCNILYNPGNAGKHMFSIFSHPGNIGKRIFSNFSYPGNIGKRMFSIFPYPGNIWILDVSYFLIILKTFFAGGAGGLRAGGVGGWGRRSHWGVRAAEQIGGRAGGLNTLNYTKSTLKTLK